MGEERGGEDLKEPCKEIKTVGIEEIVFQSDSNPAMMGAHTLLTSSKSHNSIGQ